MKKIRVVAIDDVADILDLIKYNLNKEGMDVDTYTDSAEALTSIAANAPDIVLSDWMMPEPNGLQVCRVLKSSDLTKRIPLIMLTCKGSRSDYKEALEAGAEDYVVKPVRMEELIRRIKLLLPDYSSRVNFSR
jgi:DNA-binding response OmpR family regulator